jgi:hypothetical protein
MGQEIQQSTFTELDQEEFSKKLKEETEILRGWFKRNAFLPEDNKCGLELEGWILDAEGLPSPDNQKLLPLINDPQVVPEISKFNFEINSMPQKIEGKFLLALEEELRGLWNICDQKASELGKDVAAIGILPTVRDEDLVMTNMSALTRYQALNTECLKLRDNKPFEIKVQGKDELNITKDDVMMEAAATSLQIHLQTAQKDAADLYNLSLILSAPMVALSANAPTLYEKDLWAETRIPVFEQSVQLEAYQGKDGAMIERVTFGDGYIDDLMDLFDENLKFPVLLPYVIDKDPSWLSHLRLHNGNIWRWNRPIIGLDGEGAPHLRIEHRVNSAGPSIVDVVANVGLYIGMSKALLPMAKKLSQKISFNQAKENFYTAAKDGLDATLDWDGSKISIKDLLVNELIPAGRSGLKDLGVDESTLVSYFDETLTPRAETGRNGTCWQREFLASNNFDTKKLVKAYLEKQKSHKPVHLW